MKFSPYTKLFYDPVLNAGGIPDDAVDISQADFEALVEARAAGHAIEAGNDGKPFARTPAPLTFEQMKTRLSLAVTERRWAVETGGIVLPSGARIATEKADQDRITSVIVNAQLANIELVDFKAADGWITLSIDELRSIAVAVARHVQASFTTERKHHEAIAALTTSAAVTSYDLSTGWPSQAIADLPAA